jgi:hypothetical protein
MACSRFFERQRRLQLVAFPSRRGYPWDGSAWWPCSGHAGSLVEEWKATNEEMKNRYSNHVGAQLGAGEWTQWGVLGQTGEVLR